METRLFVLDNILINYGLVQGNTFLNNIDWYTQVINTYRFHLLYAKALEKSIRNPIL